ncbi:MAG: hypothetical protein ACLU9M_11475 [Lachnospirales bacterium]|nr:MAG TPA: hypothetical protein [Bacteriophage sp.]
MSLVAFWALKGFKPEKILKATGLEKKFYYAVMEAEIERLNNLMEINPFMAMM